MCLVYFFFFFKQKTAYEMLRSLVGSEMCIRDRSMAITKEIKGAAILNNAFTAGSYAGGDGVALCSACLLYTSDAADDLLCVDLGGRRIIKKKKIHKHSKYISPTKHSSTYPLF